MYGLLSRTVKVLIWGTLGAFGAILLIIGFLQPLGIFVMFDNINEVEQMTSIGGEAAEGAIGPMKTMAAGMSVFMILQSIVCLVIGIPIVWFCLKKIYQAVTAPLPTRSDIRQEDLHGQIMAAFIFSFGVFVGFKGLERDGRIFLRDVTEYRHHYETQATIISIDPEYVAVAEDKRPYGGSKRYSGAYQFQTPDGQTITQSGPLSWNTGKRSLAGSEFYLHFHPDNPNKVAFHRIATQTGIMGDIFSCLIFIWLIAAGIAGVGANILPERDGRDIFLVETNFVTRGF